MRSLGINFKPFFMKRFYTQKRTQTNNQTNKNMKKKAGKQTCA